MFRIRINIPYILHLTRRKIIRNKCHQFICKFVPQKYIFIRIPIICIVLTFGRKNNRKTIIIIIATCENSPSIFIPTQSGAQLWVVNEKKEDFMKMPFVFVSQIQYLFAAHLLTTPAAQNVKHPHRILIKLLSSFGFHSMYIFSPGVRGDWVKLDPTHTH